VLKLIFELLLWLDLKLSLGLRSELGFFSKLSEYNFNHKIYA